MMDVDVVKLEAERSFAWHWHPAAIDPDVDYSKEPRTLVEFTLEDAPGGTKLTVVESGFDQVPAARRAEAACRLGRGPATSRRPSRNPSARSSYSGCGSVAGTSRALRDNLILPRSSTLMITTSIASPTSTTSVTRST